MHNYLKYNAKRVITHYSKYGLKSTVRTSLDYLIQHLLRHSFAHSRLLSFGISYASFLLKILRYPKRLLIRRIINFILNIPRLLKQKSVALLIKYHQNILEFICIHSYLYRKLIRPPKIKVSGRIKVLHITCSFDLGGTQRQIINLCGINSRDFEHEAIEIFPEVNYLYRKDVILNREFYSKGNIIAKQLGELILDPSMRSLQTLQIYKLVRDFEAIKPAIVVGWGHEIAMLTFVAASIARVPKIVFCIRTFNPSFGWTAIGDLLEKAHQKMIPFLSGIIVNSTLLQEDYAAWLNLSKEKISVCPNGIDPYTITENEYMNYRLDIRKRYNIDNNAVVIINIGRFSKEKGQLLLAKALKEVQLNYNNAIYCLMCGDGYTQDAVKEYAAVNGLKNIIFTGRVDKVQEFLCASDIFVMPSDFEGMPNAMLEAMGCGLPCISTKRSGAIDVARDNVEALYIDVGSVQQLAYKLSYLIERPDERIRLGRNARERLRDFSIDKMSLTFGQHLSSLLRE